MVISRCGRCGVALTGMNLTGVAAVEFPSVQHGHVTQDCPDKMQPRPRAPAPPRNPDPQYGGAFWRGGSGAFMNRRIAGMGAVGGLGMAPMPLPAPPRAPDQDEAFVEESGIKLFESRREEKKTSKPEPEDHSRDSVGEDEDDEDPLYELDVMDDTIVEDDEEEDDEEPEKEKHKPVPPPPPPAADPPPQSERSSSLSSGLGSGKSSGSVCSGGGNCGKRDSCSSSSSNASGSSRDSGVVGESWPPPNPQHHPHPHPQDPLNRNRPHRLSLPPQARTSHNFTIRRVAEAESVPSPAPSFGPAPPHAPAQPRRSNEFIDPRLADRRPLTQDAPPQPRPHTPVWLRRLPVSTSCSITWRRSDAQ